MNLDPVLRLPINDKEKLQKLGLKNKNCRIKIEPMRAYSYRAEEANRTKKLSARDLRIQIIDDTESDYILVGCTFFLTLDSPYYRVGDVVQFFKLDFINGKYVASDEIIIVCMINDFQRSFHESYFRSKYGVGFFTGHALIK